MRHSDINHFSDFRSTLSAHLDYNAHHHMMTAFIHVYHMTKITKMLFILKFMQKKLFNTIPFIFKIQVTLKVLYQHAYIIRHITRQLPLCM